MRYGVGIDLGTSFASAAVSVPEGVRQVPLSPDMLSPSVAYPAPDGSLLTGASALAAATDPTRLARGFKRRLGDPTPLVLGGTAFSPAALMAAQLRDVLTAVTSAQGGPPSSIVLTCPAIWGPYRREQFMEVTKLARVHNSLVVSEPEAAATHYSVERRLGDGAVVAVYDLGGGTFDTTILRMCTKGIEILGTPEGIEHLGGMDFDEALLANVNDRLDGAISQLDPADPAAAAALAEIRRRCEHTKMELSAEPDTKLVVPLPSGPREILISRREFNDLIRPLVLLTIDALRRTVNSAGLRVADMSAVLLAGGSSSIPLVSQLVSEELGRPVRVSLHPKYTVSLGAARIAATRVVGPPARVPNTRPAPMGPPSRAVRRRPPRGVARPNGPGGPPSVPRRTPRWLAPVATASVAVVLAAITTLVLLTTDPGKAVGQNGIDESSAGASSQAAPGGQAGPLRLFQGDAVRPWIGFIASEQNWAGAQITEDGASMAPITATPEGPDGLRVTWNGDAAGQVYLQVLNTTEDLSSYVDNDGVLAFDLVVHQGPAKRKAPVKLAAHCVYPCVGELPAVKLFRDAPTNERITVKVPLSCFVTAGLNKTRVDTPFLVYSEQAMDATFANIRWEANPDSGQLQCPDPN
jgi:molecular chaperone DnaK